MADETVVHIGENSPEHVAFRLLELVMSCEKRTQFDPPSSGLKTVDREYLLDTYAECLRAVGGLPNRKH